MSRFVMYKDKAEQFRWRFIAANGKIIAMSSESYKAKADCKHAIELIKKDGPAATVSEK